MHSLKERESTVNEVHDACVTSLKASSTFSRNKLLQDQANSLITSSRALPIDPHASPLPSSRRQTYIHSILIYPRLSTTHRASRVFHIYREATSSPIQSDYHPDFLTAVSPSRNWFVFQRGWFCLQGRYGLEGGGKGWLRNRGSGDSQKRRKAGPLTWSGSSRRRPESTWLACSFFQLLASPSSPRCRLPFDFDAFPLCYRLSLCACRPWRGKGLSLSLPPSGFLLFRFILLSLCLLFSVTLSNSPFNNHHWDITKVVGRLDL